MITDVLVVKESTIAKNPKMVEGLIRGFVDGLNFMRDQPDKAAEIIAKALDISPDEVKAQLAGIENPTLAQMSDVFAQSDALPSFFASGPVIGAILKNDGQIDSIPPIDATFDSQFVKAIQDNPGD
jgi:NitT/TauT family transport system substrate-binding protein